MRNFRESYRLSQGEFAHKLGITQGALGKLERGENQPSGLLLVALRAVYGVEPAENGDLRPAGPEDQPPAQNPELSSILKAVETIVSSNNRLVIRALKTNLEVFVQAVGRRRPGRRRRA